MPLAEDIKRKNTRSMQEDHCTDTYVSDGVLHRTHHG